MRSGCRGGSSLSCNRTPANNERPIAEPDRGMQLALQSWIIGSEIGAMNGIAIPGEFHNELVEGLADDRGWSATLGICLHLGLSRVIRLFNPVIRIAAGHPLVSGPHIERIPVSTTENWPENDIHVQQPPWTAPIDYG
jgi:hypothetical protein